MKKRLLAFVLMLTASTSLSLMAQNDTLKADSARVDEIEVYSDTTMSDTAVAVPLFEDDVDADDNFPFGNSNASVSILDELPVVDAWGLSKLIAFLGALVIIFVLAPLVLFGLLLWFVYKNRKDRMRLAEMAMKNGQPIPDELVHTAPTTGDEVRAKGIRQVFLGIGLIFLLGWVAGKVGLGIGIVVLCIGLGNVLIARSTKSPDVGLTPEDFDPVPRDNNDSSRRDLTETF